jgi:hypothetical protein
LSFHAFGHAELPSKTDYKSLDPPFVLRRLTS